MRIRETAHPLLYEINTRIWVKEVAPHKKVPTLADVPDGALDEIAGLGFDLVWLMGVWQTGAMGREHALQEPNLQRYKNILPDLSSEDVLGSPYAVQEYRAAVPLGGAGAMATFRRRLAERGVGLVLDFVPNHTAEDHPWIFSRPELYIQGDERSLQERPDDFFTAETCQGKKVIAHGRDPYFPPWSDTAQLNYADPAARAAMTETLMEIAGQCDGVRCDMSMLMLEEVFARTWDERARPADGAAPTAGEFWTGAIGRVRERYPEFVFIAEVYWNLESRLQALGFDYTYDKALYDRLLSGSGAAVRRHLSADGKFQQRAVRFLENHDERRAAEAFPGARHAAAAVISYTLPGMRFFYEGQLDGRKIQVPVQLGRRPVEERDRAVREFYERLLAELRRSAMRRGKWRRLEARSAWSDNGIWEQFVIQRWDGDEAGARLVAVNYGPHQAQCYVALDFAALGKGLFLLRDLLTGVSYEREGSSLKDPGLYLDMAPYQAHLFSLEQL